MADEARAPLVKELERARRVIASLENRAVRAERRVHHFRQQVCYPAGCSVIFNSLAIVAARIFIQNHDLVCGGCRFYVWSLVCLFVVCTYSKVLGTVCF